MATVSILPLRSMLSQKTLKARVSILFLCPFPILLTLPQGSVRPCRSPHSCLLAPGRCETTPVLLADQARAGRRRW